MRIAYVFASRERPQKFFDCLDNIQCFSDSKDYFVWVKLDYDDPKLEEYTHNLPKNYPETIVYFGHSRDKVHAINRDLDKMPEADIICVHSDDMWFVKAGFDSDIREAFKGFSGLVHFPDQVAGSQLCTYAMMSMGYYKELGYIYHPDFDNVYCDNFQTLQAQMLGRYKFVDKKILEHRHPIWGYGVADDLLKRTENPEGYRRDYETFQRLKTENGW